MSLRCGHQFDTGDQARLLTVESAGQGPSDVLGAGLIVRRGASDWGELPEVQATWAVLDGADVLAVGVLMWAASRLAARNYFYASIVITLLALRITQPLAGGASPGNWAINRLVDTVFAGVVCSLLILLARPRRKAWLG